MLAAAALAAAGAGCREVDERPNVVLVVVDTLRPDYLPEYGFDLPTSGGLASFFADSVRFERAYSTSSWTKPSVASIFSGLLPARHGAHDFEGKRLAAAIETLPEILTRHGWTAAGFSHNVNVSAQTGFESGFAHFSAKEGEGPTYPDVQEMVDETLRWLERDGDRPFFLYLQPMNVHGPYHVPPERQRDLYGRDPGRAFVYLGPIHRAVMEKGVRHRALVTDAMVVSLRERYATAVRYTMDRLAVVLDALRRSGQYERSLVVLTADHGEELYDHGGFSHGHTLYEEVVRVPLFVKLPGASPPRGTVAAAVSLADLLPTILAALRIAPPAGLDGRSLLAEITGRRRLPDDRRLVFDVRLPKRCVAQAILDGNEKLLAIDRDYEGRVRQDLLFDLAVDAAERIDLATERSERRQQLALLLRSELKRLEERAVDLSGEAASTVDRDALRALGYLD